MTPDRQKIFVDYMTFKAGTPGTIITTTAISTVLVFLADAESITRRDYLKYRKQHANYFVKYPAASEALCDFLAWNGVGFNRTKRKVADKSVEPLELQSTLNERCEKMLNEILEWLPTKRDYSTDNAKENRVHLFRDDQQGAQFSAVCPWSCARLLLPMGSRDSALLTATTARHGSATR